MLQEFLFYTFRHCTGTKTQFIIQVYISTVKALRNLDPSGVVLEIVLEPMQKYLKLVCCKTVMLLFDKIALVF